ncbi:MULTISPECIES: hypothetical protein [unclassified Janthinobacterium]|uniref:hypothetical protein n=1 Tax=unclassified Janthinobacterium TaxID=2610881 RepID=UPI0018CA33BB|nr:hypothetical protein [Janthinobacterium sp. CG_23.4]MDH6155931.1 glycosyltransferase involved in cell wall biosynthesis [Janthinobacterium sp. CG_23.4]
MRLLLIGLHTAGSGLTGVGMSLARALSDGCEVGYAGIDPTDARQRYGQLPLLAFAVTLRGCGPRFQVHPDDLKAAVASFRPTLILVIGPPYLARPLLAQLQAFRPAVKVALYAAMEAELTDPIALHIFHACDLVLTYSDFARVSVARLAAQSESGLYLPPVVAVGHGIGSCTEFYSLPDQAGSQGNNGALRQKIFDSSLGIRPSSFVVLNANRAYFRKRLDLSVAGFAHFVSCTDADAHLYLHALFIPDRERASINSLAAAAGLADRIHLIPKDEADNPKCLADLNLLYNAADVGLNTAMGEGFGLVSFEHALTGKAQVVPAHTGLLEVWQGVAELVPAVERQAIFYEYGDMFAVSASAVADALSRLYADASYRHSRGAAARALAQSERFSWDTVAQRIQGAVNGTVNNCGLHCA